MDIMAKRGRPPKYGGKATLRFMLRTRILLSERDAWKRAAKAADKSLSEWLREVANKAAVQ